jgi:hypothetical protein
MLTVLLTVGVAVAALVAGMSGAWSPCGFAMIETFTPQMCGGRRRRNLGVALFATGAILAAAVLGAVLGLAGSGLPRHWTWALVGVLALIGAARDLGMLRIALPQRRGQVPEPWRRDWPLMAWAPAYGVLLGLGVVTFQVVSTFWVVSGAAIAIGHPATSAACFALFGLGRVLMVIIPPPFAPSYSQAAVSIAPALTAVRRVNGVLLAGIGVLAIAASPVLGTPAAADVAACHGPTSTGSYWPSLSGTARAWTIGSPDGAPSVTVTQPGRTDARVACAWAPSVDGNALAYVTTGGVAVIDRTTQTQTAFVSGNVARPALNAGRLAYVVVAPGRGQALYVRNLETGAVLRVTHVPEGTDISGPSLSGATVAWAADNGRGSTVFTRNINRRGRGATRVVATAVPNTDLISPSVYGRHICWIIEHGGVRYSSKLLFAPLSGARPVTVWSVSGSTSGGQILWGTSLSAHAIATTVWHYSANHGSIAVRRI